MGTSPSHEARRRVVRPIALAIVVLVVVLAGALVVSLVILPHV